MTRPHYEDLELRVEPEPVRPICRRCGDPLPDWEWTGLCDDCVMRSGNAVGIAVVIVIFAVAIALLGWYIAAPRSAPDPGLSQAVSLGQGRTGAPPAVAEATPSVVNDPVRPAGDAPSPSAGMQETILHAVRFTGTATWYCGNGSPCTQGYGPDDLVAAIDRKDTTFRKGDVVVVRYHCGDGCLRAVKVRIVDTCACADRRVIDLTTGAFRRLAPLGMGVLPVTVELAGGPEITLPPTDEEDR